MEKINDFAVLLTPPPRKRALNSFFKTTKTVVLLPIFPCGKFD